MHRIIDKKIVEDNETEFKLVLNNNEQNIEKWAKTLVAFANSKGGQLIVGVDNDGNVKGLTLREIDKTKSLVLTTIARHIFPHINVEFIQNECKKGLYLLYVKVQPYKNLVIYKKGDFNEVVYIRQNGSSLPATIQQIISLSKSIQGIDRDITNLLYKESDYTEFQKLCLSYKGDVPTKNTLINKNIISDTGNVSVGLLMFSDTYKDDSTLVCCRLWNGNDGGVDQVIDKKEFSGNLAFVFNQTINFIRLNTKSGFIKQPNGSRIDTYSYPEIAIRESIVNALAHRDYSIYGSQIDIDIYTDRMEISSPGAWIFRNDISLYDFQNIPSKRRNFIICNCFEVAGLMEKSGSGFKKIYTAYKDLNAKLPTLYTNADTFKIILYDTMYKTISPTFKANKYENLILDFCSNKPRTRQEIQDRCKYSSKSKFIYNVLNPMLNKGLLEEAKIKGTGRTKYYIKSK